MAAATTSMVVVAFVIPLGLAVQTIAANEALNVAEVQARSLAPVIATVHDPDVLAELVRSASATSSGRLSVFMPDGQVLGASASDDAKVSLARTGRAFTSFAPDGANLFVPVVVPGSGTAVVEVAIPNSRFHRGVTAAWAILAATGLGLILLAVFVADRIARGVLVPTHALAEAAQKVSRGDLEAKVVPGGPPELSEVGRAFNILVTRISELLAAEREAAADLSHRLRTPLSALRINVDRLPKGSAADGLAEDVHAVEYAVTDVIHELRRHTREGISSTTDLVSATRERATFLDCLGDKPEPALHIRHRPSQLDSCFAKR
jgi:methyl-accepting chemotaxis protein